MADQMNGASISIDSEIIETVIGVNTKFKGTVNTDKPIRIDGVFEGIIETTSLVEVSECGRFNGEISCRSMHLVGTGEGKVRCTEVIEFASTGKFSGELSTKNLVLVEGSICDGKLEMSSMQ